MYLPLTIRLNNKQIRLSKTTYLQGGRVMPAPRFENDFKEWIDSYKQAGHSVSKDNRIYTFDNKIILIMFSLRKHKNGSLMVSTDGNNKDQLEKAIHNSKMNCMKFFCCAIYDKSETVTYPAMQDYILSIESFDYFLKPGQGTMSLTLYYEELAQNTPDFLRKSYNGTSIAFVKKSEFAKYLEYFDNRPYLGEGAFKANLIDYREWLKGKSISAQKYPHNLLIHGAPGTGKSSMIQSFFSENNIDDTHYQRVTFYEDYSYGLFVGTYKPVMSTVSKEVTMSVNSCDYYGDIQGQQIIYEFIPGPFSKILLKAYIQLLSKDTDIENYYLVIEEINRAKAASVFGDMFQLLDRKNGESVYEITPSAEFLCWFNDELYLKLGKDIDIKSIKLPPNMYIWATMNSADQGVFPLDTAFRRRWGYVYKDVHATSSKIITLVDVSTTGPSANKYDWDNFRKGINAFIEKYFDEDKCIGPGYFSDEEFSYIEEYTNAVVNNKDTTDLNNPLVDKLFSYLRQDVFRHNPRAFFEDEYLSMSQIRLSMKEGKRVTEITKLTENDFVSVTVKTT